MKNLTLYSLLALLLALLVGFIYITFLNYYFSYNSNINTDYNMAKTSCENFSIKKIVSVTLPTKEEIDSYYSKEKNTLKRIGQSGNIYFFYKKDLNKNTDEYYLANKKETTSSSPTFDGTWAYTQCKVKVRLFQ